MKLMSKYSQNDNFWPLIFIVSAVLLRLIGIDQPILEGAITRQIQTADITYNLFQNGFNFLYPQISLLPEPRYFILEPPIYNTVVAVLYKIFGVHEELGRLVSIFAFAGTAYFIFIIASKYINKSVAQSAVFVFSFSPLSIIYTRGFQPDTLALFFLTALVFYVSKWFDGEEKAFWPALIFGLLTFLSKQTYMFILISFLIMGLLIKGKQILSEKRVYIFTILTAIPSIIWSFHSRKISELFPNNFYAGNFDFSNWIYLPTFLNYEFYKTIFLWLSGLILTPIGFTLFLIGLFIKTKSKGEILLKAWLIGVIIFDLIFHQHAFTHEYYHLPLLPVASIIIGKAWWFLFEDNNLISDSSQFYLKPFKFFLLATTFAMVLGYSNSAFKLPSIYNHITDKINFFNNYTKDSDLVISSTWEALYYSRNKGWLLPYNGEILKGKYSNLIDSKSQQNSRVFLVEKFREQGASFFFALNPKSFFKDKVLSSYLEKNYTKIENKEPATLLFDLRKKIS
jgi:4-amino-4-deoxy-L-arabinose transferase-like glycosyltransferase